MKTSAQRNDPVVSPEEVECFLRVGVLEADSGASSLARSVVKMRFLSYARRRTSSIPTRGLLGLVLVVIRTRSKLCAIARPTLSNLPPNPPEV